MVANSVNLSKALHEEYFGRLLPKNEMPMGAYHLAKQSGNFGLRSNGKAIFRKIFSEIVDNLQR